MSGLRIRWIGDKPHQSKNLERSSHWSNHGQQGTKGDEKSLPDLHGRSSSKHESIAPLDAALPYTLLIYSRMNCGQFLSPHRYRRPSLDAINICHLLSFLKSYIYDCRSRIDATCGTSIPAWMSLTRAAPESFIANANSCFSCSIILCTPRQPPSARL
jgi:hypothetical protein